MIPPAAPFIETGLHLDGPVAAVELPTQAGCGAECVFLGRTRAETHPEWGPLQSLHYEAYAAMAEAELERLARDVVERHGCYAVRLVHALGVVPVGQASVVVQTLAPHRDAAFAACRDAIDRLKQTVPIWKREHWAHGETFAPGQVVSSLPGSKEPN
ncbi:MAG: molybdenum cofactor biosynthesis protein MoaE [Planctomycetota bacterium]